jgi:hypothetical protein
MMSHSRSDEGELLSLTFGADVLRVPITVNAL